MDDYAYNNDNASPVVVPVFRKRLSKGWLTGIVRLFVKFLIQGAIVAIAIKYVPTYGLAIEHHEILTIAIVAGATMYLLDRFLPTTYNALAYSM